MNYRELTWEQWEEEFRPWTEPNGELRWLETYGDEWEQVRNFDAAYVWTAIDGEGRFLNIVNGCRWVNRLNYFVTEIPAEPNTRYLITNNMEGN